LGSSTNTSGIVSIFSFVSRKRVDSDDFRVLKHIPDALSRLRNLLTKPPYEELLDDNIGEAILMPEQVIPTQNRSSLPATKIPGPPIRSSVDIIEQPTDFVQVIETHLDPNTSHVTEVILGAVDAVVMLYLTLMTILTTQQLLILTFNVLEAD
jgi:hypothetical protein